MDVKGNKPIEMGCFGLGLSRILATLIETKADDQGMIWSPSILDIPPPPYSHDGVFFFLLSFSFSSIFFFHFFCVAIAPYQILVVPLKAGKNDAHFTLAKSICDELVSHIPHLVGEVVLDDRGHKHTAIGSKLTEVYIFFLYNPPIFFLMEKDVNEYIDSFFFFFFFCIF